MASGIRKTAAGRLVEDGIQQESAHMIPDVGEGAKTRQEVI